MTSPALPFESGRPRRRWGEPIDWAVLASVLLHALILALRFGVPGGGQGPVPPVATPLQIVLATPVPEPDPADTPAARAEAAQRIPAPSRPTPADRAVAATAPPAALTPATAPVARLVQRPDPYAFRSKPIAAGSTARKAARMRTRTPVLTVDQGRWEMDTRSEAREQPPAELADAPIGGANLDIARREPTSPGIPALIEQAADVHADIAAAEPDHEQAEELAHSEQLRVAAALKGEPPPAPARPRAKPLRKPPEPQAEAAKQQPAESDRQAAEAADAPTETATEAAAEPPPAEAPATEALAQAEQARRAAEAAEQKRAEEQVEAARRTAEAQAAAERQRVEEAAKAEQLRIAQEAARERAEAVAKAEALRQAAEQQAAAERQRSAEATARKQAEEAARLAEAAARQRAEEAARAAERQAAQERQRAAEAAQAEQARQLAETAARQRAEEAARAEAARKQAEQLAAEQRRQAIAQAEQARQAALAQAEQARQAAEAAARRQAEDAARAAATRQAAEAAAEQRAQAAAIAARASTATGQGIGDGSKKGDGGNGSTTASGGGITVPLTPPPGLTLAERALQQLRQRDPFEERRPRMRTAELSRTAVAAEMEFRFYAESWRLKVERIGALNPPRFAKDGLYQTLVMTAVVNSDGSLASVYIKRGSGDKRLDEAARAIAAAASPFAPFPPKMRESYDQVEITRTWNFSEGTARLGF
ncbi:TonB family protein [Chitinimonas koreensis]|uniref:TonB family protein n=1 Tax=Chitinimonas koreensis TaxID=356302 RepID=UPI000685B7A5|nr:TonB family protein [Chitinimonas koreensis]